MDSSKTIDSDTYERHYRKRFSILSTSTTSQSPIGHETYDKNRQSSDKLLQLVDVICTHMDCSSKPSKSNKEELMGLLIFIFTYALILCILCIICTLLYLKLKQTQIEHKRQRSIPNQDDTMSSTSFVQNQVTSTYIAS